MRTLKSWIDARPLMTFSLCFLLGTISGYQNAVDWRIWCALSVFPLLMLCVRRKKIYLLCAALFFGAAWTTLALVRPSLTEQSNAEFTGIVADEAYITSDYTRIHIEDAFINGSSVPCGVMLYIYPAEEHPVPSLEYGMTISARVNTRIPKGSSNPFGYDYADALWRKQIGLTASTGSDKLNILSHASPSPKGLLIECRQRIEQVILRLYDERTAPLVCALVTGNRSLLPEEMYDQFRISGLAHLLAISGLHISCLAAALDLLLQKLRCPKGLIFALVSFLLLFYAALVGFPASICRALIMYSMRIAARLFSRKNDGFTSLGAAALILLLIDPLFIADPSFILSFSSVAGLLGLTRLFIPRGIFRIQNCLFKPLFYIASALAASLSAQLASLPAVACMFSDLPVYSLLSNLPVLPLLTLTLPIIIFSVALGLLFPSATQVLSWGIGWILNRLLDFVAQVSTLPLASISSPMWLLPIILLYALVCILCFSITKTRRRAKKFFVLLLPVLVLCALLRPLTYSKNGLEVLFLDAGQADASLIRAEDQYYLMDTGEDGNAASYLRAAGIRPAGVFISHPHSDHAAGLEYVLKVCPPAVLYLPVGWESVEADEGVPEQIEQARSSGWIIRTLGAGDVLQLSDHVFAEICQPFENMTDDANGISLVMRVSLNQSSVLFTGDLPIDDECAFFPDCDVLKVAHHGSKHSTSEFFLKMTSPSAAVISVGRNSYGHPAPELMARLDEIGCMIYRTDQNGAVRITFTEDGSISVTPSKFKIPTNHEEEMAA